MKELAELILKNRPHLSEGSVKTYVNCLKNLFRTVWGDHTEFNHKLFFADAKKVMDHLASVKFNVRKTVLSAIICISKDEKESVVEAYRKQMIEDSQKYNTMEKENKMTETQKENWIPWAEIIEKRDTLKQKVYWVMSSEKHDRENLLELQKYILLCCYTMIPPRRAKDFAEMKYSDYDEKKDNYYHKGTLHFNDYKTARFYGHQSFRVPKTLEILLNKWIKKLPDDQCYLFADYAGKKLTSSSIGKIFNSIFKKNVSVNMLRHSYITDNLGPEVRALEAKAKEMGQSTAQQKLYIKDQTD